MSNDNRRKIASSTITPVKSGSSYNFTFASPTLRINENEKDIVIGYELVQSDPEALKFCFATSNLPTAGQFSPFTISKNGQMVTWINSNTDNKTFQIKLFVYDGAMVHLVTVDQPGDTVVYPEVINMPQFP
jgi:hypothetical protein